MPLRAEWSFRTHFFPLSRIMTMKSNTLGVHLDTTTTIAEAPRSLSLRGTSGERAGERGIFIELARLIGIPSPLPSPHSSVVGRGNRPAAWWWCQDAVRQ